MEINFKAPRGFIFDISDMRTMLDGEGVFSPLVVQFLMERDLVEKLDLCVNSTIPQYPSLKNQYRDVKSLLIHFNMELHEKLPKSIVGMLRDHVIKIDMDEDILVIYLLKPLRG